MRGNEQAIYSYAISLIDSESMIPDDSTLAATSISSGGTVVANLALVEEALVILSPELFGFLREYDDMASPVLGDVSNTSDALGSFGSMISEGYQ